MKISFTGNKAARHIMNHGQVITPLLKQYFRTKLSSDYNTIDKYASDMHINPKKLQRLLHEENTTFSAELNDYRMQKMHELLKQSKKPLSIIAGDLGYSSSEALNTACKRWFGCSPKSLRKQFFLREFT